MPSFNKVFLMGNLTRDPELKYIPSGSALCEFGLAVNRTWNAKDGSKKEEVSFFDCQAWARTAEVICEYMKKGRPIFVEGYMKQERWDDKNGGGSRSKIKVVVERFQFIGGKQDQDGGAPVEAPAEAPATEQSESWD